MRLQIFKQNSIAKAVLKGSLLSTALFALGLKDKLKISSWFSNPSSKYMDDSLFGAPKNADCCGIIAYIGKKPLGR